jgi:hypothetical protein
MKSDPAHPFNESASVSDILLAELFKEIFDEISDQDISCDIREMGIASSPISFYTLLINKWVWKCK